MCTAYTRMCSHSLEYDWHDRGCTITQNCLPFLQQPPTVRGTSTESKDWESPLPPCQNIGLFCAGNHSCSCSCVQRSYHVQWTLIQVFLHLWLLQSFFSLGLIFKPCMLAVLARLEYMFTASLTPKTQPLVGMYCHPGSSIRMPTQQAAADPVSWPPSQSQGLFSSNWHQ